MRIASALILLLTPALLWAAPAAPDKDDKVVSPVEKVRNDLDRPITLKIDKQSLTAAIEMLREKSKIHLVLDSLTIQQQLGFAPDQPPMPVSVDLKEVKARTALRSILTPYGLGYAVLGDTVVVTTEDMAMLQQMRQRVSVDVSKMQFGAALKQISRETAVNLILDSRVDKESQVAVSLQIEDVPLETAVRLLSEMAGLKPVRVGNTLFVTKKEIANEMRNDPEISQLNQTAGIVLEERQTGFIIGNNVLRLAVPQLAPNPVLAPGPAPAPPVVPPTAAPPGSGTGAAAPASEVKKVVDEEKPPAPDPAPAKKDESK